MADVRKSAKQTAARSRAREKAAGFRAKEDNLEQLATNYFVATDSLKEIEAATRKEIAALQQLAAKQNSDARTAAEAVITSMLELGIPRSEIADRLGITVREVRK